MRRKLVKLDNGDLEERWYRDTRQPWRVIEHRYCRICKGTHPSKGERCSKCGNKYHGSVFDS